MNSRTAAQSSIPPSARASGLFASSVGDQPEVMLVVAQAVAAHTDLAALLRDLARALEGHVPSGYLSFALIEPDRRSAKLQFLQPVSGAAAPDQAEPLIQFIS